MMWIPLVTERREVLQIEDDGYGFKRFAFLEYVFQPEERRVERGKYCFSQPILV